MQKQSNLSEHEGQVLELWLVNTTHTLQTMDTHIRRNGQPFLLWRPWSDLLLGYLHLSH